jgi:hypothetical protein
MITKTPSVGLPLRLPEPKHTEEHRAMSRQPLGWRVPGLPDDDGPIERCKLIEVYRGQDFDARPASASRMIGFMAVFLSPWRGLAQARLHYRQQRIKGAPGRRASRHGRFKSVSYDTNVEFSENTRQDSRLSTLCTLLRRVGKDTKDITDEPDVGIY